MKASASRKQNTPSARGRGQKRAKAPAQAHVQKKGQASQAKTQSPFGLRGNAHAENGPAIIDFTSLDAPQGETADVIDIFTGKTLPTYEAAVEALRVAMGRAARRPLPKREALEAHLNSSLADFSAVWSSEIASLLKSLGAEAAVLGDQMALPSEDVSFETLVHETAHLLQTLRGARGTEQGDAVAKAPAGAEAEAETLTGDQGQPQESLGADVIAFRSAEAAQGEQTDWQASQEFRAQMQSSEAQSGEARSEDGAGSGAGQSATGPQSSEQQGNAPQEQQTDAAGAEAETAAAETEQAPGIESDLPPLPEEAEAAKEALDASIAALSEAATPEAYMTAFKDAPPSLKAEKSKTLDADIAQLSAQEGQAFVETQPDFEARMSGDDSEQTSVAPVLAPEATEPQLEETAPAPAPEPEIAETQDATPFEGNAFLSGWAPPLADRVDPAQVAGALSDVQTTDSEVQTSPGPAPAVPLEGESDPGRAREQADAANLQAAQKRDEAAQAVLDGPGPEQVEMREVTETISLQAEERTADLDEMAAVEGADEFLNKDLDSETKAIFDAHHDSAMKDSLAEADGQMEAMVSERDAKREAETTKARSDMAEAEKDANDKQAEEVGNARQTIQSERQSTLDKQASAVAEMNEEAEAENQKTQDQISARVAEDEARIDQDFKEAEGKAEAKLESAEAEAKAEKEKAEKEAEGGSWWDRAVDWVGEQLSKLGDLIGKIFDAVREGINVILDGVKSIAFALIDAAADFIKGAIELYGEFLKLAVTALVGSVFPELAEALNAAIDEGVRLAKAAVDVVADGLKAAVSFIVDAYKAALNAVLDFVQGALNTVLAVAQAALSGDWGEVARLIIEPILSMLGIHKDDFYAFLSNAADGLMKIVDDPIAFLGHLLDTVVGGFKLFGANFVDHLIGGIIGWLTGALGGTITIPKTWDLLGVLDLARQILGLTVDMLRRIAVRILGEAAVERIEFFLGYAQELITGGWGAFFEKVKQDLGSLFSMVMGEITTFLLERVVKAGIVWLASLINPAGALVKLVLMIWDFIMWMKDNLSRFVQIITTVVNGMVDIANGRIEAASQAIEAVLARLLPPAIDLIARLIGLGNVAGSVRKVIEKIRKTIEDAIVKLIKRVLAKFTGGGSKSKSDKDDAASGGDLMAPIRFSGGGESHTLYVEQKGKDVVPMMRSTPTAVQTWLEALKTDAGVKAQLVKSEPDVSEQAVSDKREKIAPLVAKALTEEQEMDKDGDGAAAAEQKDASKAKDDKAELKASAEETASAMELILKELGLSEAPDFKVKFSGDIAKVRNAFSPTLEGEINRRINADPGRKVAYTDLDWAGVRAMLSTDTQVLTQAWAKPLHSGGALRDEKTFMTELYKAAVDAVKNEEGHFGIAEPDKFLSEDAEQKKFMAHLLKTMDVAGYQTLMDKMLGPRNAGYSRYVADITTQIESSVKAYAGEGEKEGPDAEFKANIKASSFKEGGLFETQEFLTKKLTYYKQQDASGAGVAGTEGGQHGLPWFLNRVPEGSTEGSSRAQKNVTYLADMIRAADPGQHEWILSSQANQAISASIAQLDSSGVAPAEGFANFVRFQHEVRTPTSNLVFSPSYTAKTNAKTIGFTSAAHLAAVKSGEAPETAAERDAFYEGLPAFGTPVATVQAHAGGLYTIQIAKDGTTIEDHGAWGSSPKWHESLRTKVSGVLGRSGGLDLNDMKVLGESILGYFDETIFNSASDTSSLVAAGKGYGQYRFSGGGPTTTDFADLIKIAADRQEDARKDLISKINSVIQPMKVSA